MWELDSRNQAATLPEKIFHETESGQIVDAMDGPIITPPKHDSVPSCNKIRSEIKPSVMPSALKFYLYLFVAGVVVVVVAVRWLAPNGS